MKESDFENELLLQLNNNKQIINKIKINKKFNYLPYCEKYDEKTLLESKNLNLSEEQKQYIRENYKIGEWIYKIPEIKVKLLSKNLGCTNNEVSQLIYCTGKKQTVLLNTFKKGNEEKITLINENNFNILNMNEISSINHIDNFQWKTGIKFNNQLQMNSFLKLLTLARQNINTKEKNRNLNNINDFDSDKMEEFDKKKKGEDLSDEESDVMGNKTCEISVEFIDFIDKLNLEYDPTYIKIQLPGQTKKSIYPLLVDNTYGFKNSLANKEKIKEKVENYSERQGKDKNRFEFKKKLKIGKQKFNSGNKYLYMGNEIKSEYEIKMNKKSLDIYIIMFDKNNKYKEEYNSTIDLSKILSNEKLSTKLELPIYKKDNNEKIYGCLGINLFEKKGDDMDFEKEYIEANKSYISQPLKILKEQINPNNNYNFQAEDYHFKLYEPNIFRRKILNFVHSLPEINIDPNNIENISKRDLEFLEKKNVELPDDFKFYNIKKNFGDYYKEKLALKLLKNKRHEDFMKIFREKEWNLYMNKINKGEKGMSGIQYIQTNPDKKEYVGNVEDSKALRDLIYLGIPQNYRLIFYKSFLETNKLYSKTREKIYKETTIDLENEMKCFSYFADKILEEENRKNLIFSLIFNIFASLTLCFCF